MRIVYIVCSLAQKAGVERVVIDKMNYFSHLPGYEIFLLTYEQGEHPIAFPLSDKIKHIRINTKFHNLYKYGIVKRACLILRMKFRFKKLLRQHIARIQPDIIVSTTLPDTVIDIIMGLKDRSKKVIETHTERYSLKAKEKTVKIGWTSFIDHQYEKYISRQIARADAFVTLTEEDARSWRNVKEAVVIPNVLTYYPSEIGHLPRRKQIISVGRLERQKGYDLLLEAWKKVHSQHPDWELNIYGNGSKEQEILDQANKLSLDGSFKLLPPTSDIYDRYQESAIYVMSSRFEGFGLVLIEAMSCGVPCVSFNCPHGPSVIIKDGEDGLLVEDGNIAQLTEKICYLIEHEDIRIEMGRKARENAKRYLPENIMPQWEKSFNNLTQNIRP